MHFTYEQNHLQIEASQIVVDDGMLAWTLVEMIRVSFGSSI